MLKKIVIYVEHDGKYYITGYNKAHQVEYFLMANTADLNSESVYMARIDNINHKNKTAFVNFGEATGFVNLNKSQKLQAGSMIFCQIRHFAGIEDSKQTKLSTDISYVGRYIILTKGYEPRFYCREKHIDQLKLIFNKHISEPIGVIFRTNINCADDLSVVEDELLELLSKKNNISKQMLKKLDVGSLDDGVPFYLKFIRDSQFTYDLEIITNHEGIFNHISSYVNMWQLDKLSLDKTYTMNFSEINHDKVIQKDSISLELHKLSGINLIDVNSKNAQLSFFKINYLALDEIVLQIKLKDLTGIILLDLIKNMSIQEHQQIISKLSLLLKDDWRNNKVLGFTNAGIVEIIRNK